MIKQISVFVENKPGSLIKITDALAQNNVDMRAFSVADTQDFGILRIIVDNTEKALEALGKISVLATLTDMVAVAVSDRPGGMSEILGILRDNKINIEYAYAFVSGGDDGAYVALRVGNVEEAEKILREHGIREISEKDI